MSDAPQRSLKIPSLNARARKVEQLTKDIEAVCNQTETAPLHEYLKGRFFNEIHLNEERVTRNGLMYQLFETLLIIFSILTPALVAQGVITQGKNLNLAATLLAIGTSVTTAILANLLRIFNYQEKRNSYRIDSEALLAEFYRFKAKVEPYKDDPDKDGDTRNDRFVMRVEDYLAKTNTTWASLHEHQNVTTS